MGKLLDIAGPSGTQVLEICCYATFVEAASSGRWNIRQTWGYHLRAMIDRIHSVPSPVDETKAGCPLWHHGDEDFRPTFSATNIWNLTHEHHHRVPWSKLLWFTQAVPRFSFFTWLPFKDKLSTGERTRSWGIVQSCRLCGEPNETSDHLIFACPFSYTLWTELVGYLLDTRDTPDCTDTASFLLSNSVPKLDLPLLCLVFQATIHSIWRERNAQKHKNEYWSVSQTRELILIMW